MRRDREDREPVRRRSRDEGGGNGSNNGVMFAMVFVGGLLLGALLAGGAFGAYLAFGPQRGNRDDLLRAQQSEQLARQQLEALQQQNELIKKNLEAEQARRAADEKARRELEAEAKRRIEELGGVLKEGFFKDKP